MKNIISLLLAGLFVTCMLVSCNDSAENLSSTPVSSEITHNDEASSQNNTSGEYNKNSSTITAETPQNDKASSQSSGNNTSGEHNKNSSTITTNSAPLQNENSSTKKPGINRVSSESESQSVKYYNNGTLGIGAHEFRIDLCTAAGSNDKAKLQEFADVVEEGYFNTYFVPFDENLLNHMNIIAKSGGTVWLSGTRNITETNIDSIIDDIKFYLDLLDENGYKDLVNGVYWYQPIWNGLITNSEFLKLTQAIYQKLGLRNFPTFAPHNFVSATGRESEEQADKDSLILPSSLKYVTDISFTSYGYDVRDGVIIPDSKLNDLHNTVSPEIKTTGDYYIYLKEKLHNYVGHPVNTWYYACAYDTPVSVGLNGLGKADESYCVAHLEFMANDVLKSQCQGGIIIHKYYINGEGIGFQRHLPLRDAGGRYKYYPNEEKWEEYGHTLKKIKIKFDSKKANLAKIS